MRRDEVRFGSTIEVGRYRVTPIVRSWCRVDEEEDTGAWGSGGVEPLGVLVEGGVEGAFALGLDGSPLPYVEG